MAQNHYDFKVGSELAVNYISDSLPATLDIIFVTRVIIFATLCSTLIQAAATAPSHFVKTHRTSLNTFWLCPRYLQCQHLKLVDVAWSANFI